MQEELLHSICTAGPPGGSIRLQCCPRNLEKWLAVSFMSPLVMHCIACHISRSFTITMTMLHCSRKADHQAPHVVHCMFMAIAKIHCTVLLLLIA